MSKAASAKFSISVKAGTKHRLEKLAEIAGRSSSFLAAEAISEYLDVNEVQVFGIKNAIASLDRGETVSHAKVREWVLSWDSPHEQPIPRPLMI
jgi:RHH-type transcriptional regulator, rel operon repressor / antitoxin RelB